jgi:polyhydroxyalkanoate synthesis repressor PhaR
MNEKRVIKKYPNRRLYDTVESKYVTLDDVRRLALNGTQFCVIDQKTGDDITRSILLQIIIEQEDGGQPIFTTDALLEMVRFYGDTVRGLASNFLERSVSIITEQQKQFHTRMNQAVKSNPLTAMTELTQNNLKLWQDMQEQFFKAAGVARKDADAEQKSKDPEQEEK